MTTSWAHVVRGQIVDAMRANVAGAVLAMASVTSVPWLIGTVVLGRRIGAFSPEGVLAIVLSVVVVLAMAEWGIRYVAR
jgi:hypothetical protein